MPKRILEEAGSRPGYGRDVSGWVGGLPVSPSMAEGHWERPRGLLLLSLAWLAAGQAGGEHRAVGEPPAERGRAHCPRGLPEPGGLPGFIAGRSKTLPGASLDGWSLRW